VDITQEAYAQVRGLLAACVLSQVCISSWITVDITQEAVHTGGLLLNLIAGKTVLCRQQAGGVRAGAPAMDKLGCCPTLRCHRCVCHLACLLCCLPPCHKCAMPPLCATSPAGHGQAERCGRFGAPNVCLLLATCNATAVCQLTRRAWTS